MADPVDVLQQIGEAMPDTIRDLSRHINDKFNGAEGMAEALMELYNHPKMQLAKKTEILKMAVSLWEKCDGLGDVSDLDEEDIRAELGKMGLSSES